MAAPNTGPSRRLVLTDRGRRVLAFDRASLGLPASYHAWGAIDSPVCENGHPRCQGNVMRDGGCRACRQREIASDRRVAA
jgi:hypothetical protein